MILGYKKLTLKGPHQNGDPIGHRLWRWARWRLKGLWPQKSKVQARPGTGKDVAGCRRMPLCRVKIRWQSMGHIWEPWALRH
jgi:hypothetical protein